MTKKNKDILEYIKYGKLKLIDLEYSYNECVKYDEFEKVQMIKYLIDIKYYDNNSVFNFTDDEDMKNMIDGLDSLKEFYEEEPKEFEVFKSKVNNILGDDWQNRWKKQHETIIPPIKDEKIMKIFLSL